jgi:predicted Fe-Mo cluster-binding NifX family protein
MKTAFAYWENRIAPVFDTARQVLVVETDSRQIVGKTQEMMPEDLPLPKVLRLVDLGIETLVCGAISNPMSGLVGAYGIRVIPFITGELGEIIQAWANGKLEYKAYTMPGCCRHGRHRRRKAYADNRNESGGMGKRHERKGKGCGQNAGRTITENS